MIDPDDLLVLDDGESAILDFSDDEDDFPDLCVIADELDREAAPAQVYRLYDGQGDLIYIGCTGSVASRLTAHMGRKHWWPEVRSIVIDEPLPRRDALDAEAAGIRSEHPHYNIQHRVDL